VAKCSIAQIINVENGIKDQEKIMKTVSYNIPKIGCGHCKMKIEREIGKISGVASVSVDVDAKNAIIEYDSPATKSEIESSLIEIGYPSEN